MQNKRAKARNEGPLPWLAPGEQQKHFLWVLPDWAPGASLHTTLLTKELNEGILRGWGEPGSGGARL